MPTRPGTTTLVILAGSRRRATAASGRSCWGGLSRSAWRSRTPIQRWSPASSPTSARSLARAGHHHVALVERPGEVAVLDVVAVPGVGQRLAPVHVVPARVEAGAGELVVHLPVDLDVHAADLVDDLLEALEGGQHVEVDRKAGQLAHGLGHQLRAAHGQGAVDLAGAVAGDLRPRSRGGSRRRCRPRSGGRRRSGGSSRRCSCACRRRGGRRSRWPAPTRGWSAPPPTR